MNDRPLVSVIIPVYNGELYLAAAIDSVLAQDYHPIELLVVDDGSTDSTPEIIRSYPAARCIRQANQGHGAAKNTGLAQARGAFIAFLDADDIWHSYKAGIQAAALMADPSLDYVTCHSLFLREPGQDWPKWINPALYHAPHPQHVPSALMARRAAFDRIGPFDTRFWHANDTDWIMRARDAGLRGLLLPQVLFDRRVHASNLSNDMAGLRAETFRLLHASAKRKQAEQRQAGNQDA